ncbi:glycosyltransferase family 61 protein [Lutimaribacter marinistellae]|uniref:Glycosyltransferase family 61 protein n=1 Tax=Lutimaribacter marinistellae TaxID=1820329 RepID=A0ABV7TEG7_9RHOB
MQHVDPNLFAPKLAPRLRTAEGPCVTLVPGVSCAEGAVVIGGPDPNSWNLVDRTGAPILDGTTYRLGRHLYPRAVDARELADGQTLSGTWLYAGDYWNHFGHFLFESLARIWVMEHLDLKLDGILYVWPRHGAAAQCRDDGFQRDLLRRCGADLPVRIVNETTRVERLVVPRQGCGLGPMAAGTPEFRSFIRERLRAGIRPGSHRKLYLSRAGYWLRRGGHFDEERLTKLLVNEGYHEFRPEKYSLSEQIAAYMGAEKIVAPDGSALHLVAFVAEPEQRVAVILRRHDGGKDIVPNLTGCMGRAPLVIDKIDRFHRRTDMKNPNWNCFAELELQAVGADLHSEGFIDAPHHWQTIRHRRRQRLLAQYGAKLSCSFRTEELNEDALTEFPDGTAPAE